MDTSMDMPPTKMPTEGWVLIILTALGAKPLWDYLTKKRAIDAAQERERADHSQEIELRKLTTAEKQDHKLVTTLERQVKTLEGRMDEMALKLTSLTDERTQDKVTIAEQAARIIAQDAEIARLQGESDQYRMIAETGQRVAERAGHDSAARQIGEEISEVIEASKSAGGKP